MKDRPNNNQTTHAKVISLSEYRERKGAAFQKQSSSGPLPTSPTKLRISELENELILRDSIIQDMYKELSESIQILERRQDAFLKIIKELVTELDSLRASLLK